VKENQMSDRYRDEDEDYSTLSSEELQEARADAKAARSNTTPGSADAARRVMEEIDDELDRRINSTGNFRR
jgi:hypothetical protein